MRHDDLNRYRSYYRNVFTRYSALKELCKDDSLFRELLAQIELRKDYFQRLEFEEAIIEISWWLFRMDISCKKTEMYSPEDFKAFALFLIIEFGLFD